MRGGLVVLDGGDGDVAIRGGYGTVVGTTQTDRSERGAGALFEGCMLDPENQGPNCAKYRPEAAITYTLRCRRIEAGALQADTAVRVPTK